jgi:hypothetical protein
MKYYNKDYENSVVDDKTEGRLEEVREIDQENEEITESQKIWRNPLELYIELYRERHNGYPSDTIIILSILSSFFITLCLTIIIVDVLNTINNAGIYTFLEYFIIIFIIVSILIIYFFRYFFQDDGQQTN